MLFSVSSLRLGGFWFDLVAFAGVCGRLVLGLHAAAFWVGDFGGFGVFLLGVVVVGCLGGFSGSVLACSPHYGGFGVFVVFRVLYAGISRWQVVW